MPDVDVLIVGAGPTGLMAAIELARRDVTIRIIERKPERTTRSKALVLHARTLEFFDILGIADDHVRSGYTSPGIDFSANMREPVRATLFGVRTRFPFILIIPQADTEQALEERLKREGVAVERGVALSTFVQNEHGVTAQLRHQDGREESIVSRYMLGADGSHSLVRAQLGIPFEGSSYPWTALLGDGAVDGLQAEGGTEQHSADRGLAFVVPFEDGTFRIVTIDSNYQDYPPGKQLELAELEELASAIIGRPIRMKDPKWLSAWGSDLKIARTYRLGCVFIAGDAAHTHSPAGGQGLNTGVQDAFNLAWKLAAVIKGWAPAHLLDSYEAERHAIGKRVLKASDVLLRTLLIRRPLGRWLRDRIVRALVKTGSINRFLVLNLSAIGFRYRTGTGKRAGQRLPDMTFRGPARAPERTYELLRDSLGYTLFLFVSPKQARQLARNIQAIIALGSPLLRVHVVLSSGLPESYDFGVPFHVDFCGDWHTLIGNDAPRAILVRPDAYIAFDQRGLDVARIRAGLASWMVDAQAKVVGAAAALRVAA